MVRKYSAFNWAKANHCFSNNAAISPPHDWKSLRNCWKRVRSIWKQKLVAEWRLWWVRFDSQIRHKLLLGCCNHFYCRLWRYHSSKFIRNLYEYLSYFHWSFTLLLHHIQTFNPLLLGAGQVGEREQREYHHLVFIKVTIFRTLN